MTPEFIHNGVTSYQGHALTVLSALPGESVHCIVTSPPYFGLRKYSDDVRELGTEATLACYVQNLARVVNEAGRVLRRDGTLFLNLGDSYANDQKWGGKSGGKHALALHGSEVGRRKRATGLAPKNLCGAPWRVAFALQDAGWVLRNEIVWAKPSPMPEPTRDRFACSHEKIFFFSKKSKGYYFDWEAVAEPSVSRCREMPRPQYLRAREIAQEKGLTEEHLAAIRAGGLGDAGKNRATQSGSGRNAAQVQALALEAKEALGGYHCEFLTGEFRRPRDVWNIATSKSKAAHHAVFPVELARRCILAGCPAGGTVLDPFFGSGTTGRVAAQLGRSCLGIELNPEYIQIQRQLLGAD